MASKTPSQPTEAQRLTVEEVATRLHCSVSTVWRMARRGALRTEPYYGRTVFHESEVAALQRSKA